MKLSKKYNQETSALKVGIDVKTGRKYLRKGCLPSELKVTRDWRTRKDPFLGVWDMIESKLKQSPQLKPITLLRWLMDEDGEKFSQKNLRTLQKRVQEWRILHGCDQAVIFPQEIQPGRQSQSDFTRMDSLGILIGGQPFAHLLFHFMLPFSCWETTMVCYSESFESLSEGYERAVWELGGVTPEHRTDNLSAAVKKVGNRKLFTERWSELLDHYEVRPSRNQPGVAHENGSVEKSHDLLKQEIEQQLLLRGSRHFVDLADYESFLKQIVDQRNKRRKEKVSFEVSFLKDLPVKKYYAPVIIRVRVSTASTVRLLKGVYSVPSRLIRSELKAYIYPREIELYYGKQLVQKMPRLAQGQAYLINYRHIIHHLVRKPGAFAQYQYREGLFPRQIFRKAYDHFMKHSPTNGHKAYLRLLHLSAQTNEGEVASLVEQALQAKQTLDVEVIRQALVPPSTTVPDVTIDEPKLEIYDLLLGRRAA